jgi:hypothetical protein
VREHELTPLTEWTRQISVRQAEPNARLEAGMVNDSHKNHFECLNPNISPARLEMRLTHYLNNDPGAIIAFPGETFGLPK